MLVRKNTLKTNVKTFVFKALNTRTQDTNYERKRKSKRKIANQTLFLRMANPSTRQPIVNVARKRPLTIGFCAVC